MPAPTLTTSHGKSRPQLLNLSPLEQLKAGKLTRRVVQLVAGLALFGMAMGMFVEARVGLDPWDVFHQGVSRHVPLDIGQVAVIASLLLLLLWIPLRQMPGLGTIANAFILGIAMNITIAVLPTPQALPWRIALFALGLFINGIGGAMYIGAQLGPGPRDGIMTGLNRTFGISVRAARTAIEVTALAIGSILGGNVGVGTVIFALTIGPMIQFWLPFMVIDLPGPHKPAETSIEGD